MRKLLLASTMLGAIVSSANAVVVGVNNGGPIETYIIGGVVDTYGSGNVPGLTSSLGLTYLGSLDNGITWKFSYTLTNTTSGGINDSLVSRIYSWGLVTDPTLAGATVNFGAAPGTVVYDRAIINTDLGPFSINFCATPGGGCGAVVLVA